ncbi:MAG: hypothetical protein IJX47_02925 [Clostridia bacterium]|nr:hypothetical protein [Clostridia bacterium]
MREIKELSKLIDDEIDAACEYVEAAAKAEDEGLKTLYIELATAELGHVDRLHAKAKSTIERAKADKTVEIPTGMRDIWEWEHERVICKVAKIKSKLETVRAM